MTSTDRIHLIAVLVHDDAHSVQVEQHLSTPEAYAETIAGRDVTEHTALDQHTWHRWARFTLDGVEYVAHDPQHHLTDPCSPERRIAELMDMMGRVVLAADMGAAEKVRELTRLSARMREIAPATYSDGSTDATTEALDVVADALARGGAV